MNKTPEINTASVQEFLGQLADCPNDNEFAWIYRGQSKSSWELLPKAGRAEYHDPDWNYKYLDSGLSDEDRKGHFISRPPRDIGRFNYWKRGAMAYHPHLPTDPFECLALAQHYGLATRLLDWTANPLVALFFACEREQESSGAVFAYLPNGYVDYRETKMSSVLLVAAYLPPALDRRIVVQRGVFTYHPRPEKPLLAEETKRSKTTKLKLNLVKFLITAENKRSILLELFKLNITRASLFPDLEGHSEFVNWETRINVAP